jgi:CRISPR-associated protein Cas5d
MKTLSVVVGGKFACFTHPALKTERASYKILTPSAAVGILSCIYWKPEFVWQIKSIELLTSVKSESIMMNELKEFGSNPITISKQRTQRYTERLLDQRYVIHAEQIMTDEHTLEDRIKHEDTFNKRVQSGKCFRQPFLGLKEFVCDFEVYNPDLHKPLPHTEDLGTMLQYIVYPEANRKKLREEIKPVFFHAQLVDGVMTVPALEERYAFN